MTFHELVNQLCEISVDCTFNGERFNKKWLSNYLKQTAFRFGDNRWFMTIKLPDKEWLFTVTKDSRFGRNYYDYYIPETEEQENILFHEFAS